MRKLFVLFLLVAGTGICQESLSSFIKSKILKLYPATDEERQDLREHDIIIIENNDEKMECTIISFDDDVVDIRLEGQRIPISRFEIKRILLAQDLIDVFDYRLSKLKNTDYEKMYTLAMEGLAREQENEMIVPWAEDVLKKCAKHGGHVSAYVKVGDLFAERQEYVKAGLYYRKGVELSENNFEAISSYAVNLRTLKKYMQAEKWFKKAVHLNEDNIEILEGLGFVLIKQARAGEAKPYYVKALESDAENGLVNIGYAYILAYEKLFLEAREHFNKALSADENTREMYTGIGMLDYKYGVFNRAEGNFHKALDLSEESERYNILAHLSVIHSLKGDFNTCEEIFGVFDKEEILANPEVSNAIGFYYVKKGDAFGQEQKDSQAREAYSMAKNAFLKGISGLEDNYYGLYGIGVANLRLGDTREGIKSLDRAYRANSRFVIPKLTIASYYLRNEEFALALQEYDTIIKNNIDELKSTYKRLHDEEQKGDSEDVRYLANEAEHLLKLTYIGRLMVLIHKNSLEEAEKTAAALLTAVPGCAEVYDYWGYISVMRDEREKAKEYFKTGKKRGSAYSKKRYADLLIAENQKEYLDDFNREDNPHLRNSWNEVERVGIEISVSGGKALFEGIVSKSWAQTHFSKNYRASSVINASVMVELLQEDSKFFTGLFILGQKNDKGIFIIRNDTGKICYSSSDLQKKGKGWQWFPVRDWPSTEMNSFSIVQADRSMRKFELYVNDKRIKTLMAGSLIKEEYFKIGCFVQGKKGTEINVLYDDIRVIVERMK